LGDAAVYVQSSYLDTLFGYVKMPCPYNKYGCASSVAYRDVAAHAAACACAPCRCPCADCSFEGSPAELLSHLTDKAGGHGAATTNITYGQDYCVVFGRSKHFPGKQLVYPMVAEDDGSVFLLAVDGWSTPRATVVCVRGASAGPVYTSSLTVEGPPAEGRSLTLRNKVVRSSPLGFDVEAEPDCDCVSVYPEMLHGEKDKKIHLRICIGKA
jgi:E3 ubiquitin-protein ligase SIAH1